MDLVEVFFFQQCYVMVLEKLGLNLYQKLVKDKPRGFSLKEVRQLGR